MHGKTAWLVVYDLKGLKEDFIIHSVAKFGGRPCFARSYPEAPYLCVTQLDSTVISFRHLAENEVDSFIKSAVDNKHLVAQDMMYALGYNIEDSAKRLRALESGLSSVKGYLAAYIESVVAKTP